MSAERDAIDAALAHQQELEYQQWLLAQDAGFTAWLDSLSTQQEQEPDTMKIGQMLESKYLKKEDVDPPKLLTITGFDKVNVARQDEAPDLKWLMKFAECKPMVINSTNLQLAAKALGSEETDHWIGKKIVAYNDPNVSFGDKLVGGIRLRAARIKGQPAPAPIQVAAGEEEFDDDIPF